jgi:hypothetical protein
MCKVSITHQDKGIQGVPLTWNFTLVASGFEDVAWRLASSGQGFLLPKSFPMRMEGH